MSRSNNSLRVARMFAVALTTATILTLSACGSSSEPATQPTQALPPQAPAKDAPTTPNTAAPSDAPSEATATATPPPVSQVDDGSESINDTPLATTAAPSLKLASDATVAPKAAPSSFKEGQHYQRLVPTQPTQVSPGQVEIVEIFWYGCAHCFALDSKLESWRQKTKPSYAVFRRIPATWNDATLFHGRVFYTAELLGKLEELHTLMFREIHLNGNLLNTMDKSKAFFTAHGVAKADFDKTFASFGLESKLQNANMLNKRYRVQGVPFFVVNGKYTADVTSAGGEEQLLQLLNELAVLEHGG